MIIFNGVDLRTKVDKVNDVRRDILPPRSLNTLIVPERDGAYFSNITHDVRVFEVDVTITGSTKEALRQKIHDLAYVLNTDAPAELVFTDDLSLSYSAILSGESSLKETKSRIAQGTLIFVCLDPYAWGARKTVSMSPGAVTDLTNGGNAEAFPKFTVQFKAPSTFLALIGPDTNLLIGDPDSPDRVKVPKEQLVFHDPMEDTSNWVAPGFVPDGDTLAPSVVTGTMYSNGASFRASSYGTGTGWHGPMLKRALPTPVQDFKMEAYVGLDSTAKDQLGRIEIYLLDANGAILGKMSMLDRHSSVERNYALIRGGTYTRGYALVNYGSKAINKKKYFKKGKRTYAKYVTVGYQYNNFDGILRIERRGKKWSAFVGKYDSTGKRLIYTYKRSNVTLTSSRDPNVENKVAQIAVHLGAWSTRPAAPSMWVASIKIWKLNAITSTDIPEIIDAGDIIEIDHNEGSIYKNGDVWMDYLDIGSDFFSLPPKATTQVEAVSEDGGMIVNAEIQERWL